MTKTLTLDCREQARLSQAIGYLKLAREQIAEIYTDDEYFKAHRIRVHYYCIEIMIGNILKDIGVQNE